MTANILHCIKKKIFWTLFIKESTMFPHKKLSFSASIIIKKCLLINQHIKMISECLRMPKLCVIILILIVLILERLWKYDRLSSGLPRYQSLPSQVINFLIGKGNGIHPSSWYELLINLIVLYFFCFI